jgi:hypothetical protein
VCREEVTDPLGSGCRRWDFEAPESLELPAAVYAVARRALATARTEPVGGAHASVLLTSGVWLTLHAAALKASGPERHTVAVTLAPAA